MSAADRREELEAALWRLTNHRGTVPQALAVADRYAEACTEAAAEAMADDRIAVHLRDRAAGRARLEDAVSEDMGLLIHLTTRPGRTACRASHRNRPTTSDPARVTCTRCKSTVSYSAARAIMTYTWTTAAQLTLGQHMSGTTAIRGYEQVTGQAPGQGNRRGRQAAPARSNS